MVEHGYWMAEEFTRGCYGAHFAPGVWTSYGEAWRAPAGRIHWAGAEYAPSGTATWRVLSAAAKPPQAHSPRSNGLRGHVRYKTAAQM